MLIEIGGYKVNVLTQKDVDNGNPQRQTSVGRSSEESSWEVITERF